MFCPKTMLDPKDFEYKKSLGTKHFGSTQIWVTKSKMNFGPNNILGPNRISCSKTKIICPKINLVPKKFSSWGAENHSFSPSILYSLFKC